MTGGAGFIGSHLVDKLIKDKHEVIVIDNESALENEKFYWNDRALNYKYDICDYKKIYCLFNNIDCVFHLAAQSRIQPSIIDADKTFKINYIGTLNVLKASKEHNVLKFIFSSSSACYGLKNKVPFKEDMAYDCLNPYSYSKALSESLCKMYSQLYGMNIFVLRYFNVYGHRQPMKGLYAPVIGTFQKQFKNNKKMTVVGDGMQRRDYTYVDDVVFANIKVAFDKKINGFEILNVGTGVNYNMLEIVEMIGGKYKFIPNRLGEAKETLADISKIKQMINWSPKIMIKDWIKNNI